jgi:hypothetical protein
MVVVIMKLVAEGVVSQLLGSTVHCLVGRIEGVTAMVAVRIIGDVCAGLDEEAEVDVAVILSAVIRRRVCGLGL